MKAAARARANVALVKYWGKADDGPLNIPAVGSISITLDALWTDTQVEFDASLADDELTLNGQLRPEAGDRVRRCLDLLRKRAGGGRIDAAEWIGEGRAGGERIGAAERAGDKRSDDERVGEAPIGNARAGEARLGNARTDAERSGEARSGEGRAGFERAARVTSRNNFPTGAGLASSASGYAALAAAAAAALNLELTARELSIVARQGSGSAARSIFGGFVEMHAGRAADGSDSYAEPLMSASAWPLEVVVAVTERAEKAVGSRAGMARSAATSPYYPAWVAAGAIDLESARRAILGKDFEALAEVAERNCCAMHGAAMAARPPLLYWNATTVACLRAVRGLRRAGVPVFFTIDAGPQLKAVCAPGAADRVRAELTAIAGVADVLVSGLGPGAAAVPAPHRDRAWPA